ncbi:MAG: phage tail tape measure protein [Candidatus Paceibacterota bacterium]|jgi:TP901 family phage tail tape measure protein
MTAEGFLGQLFVSIGVDTSGLANAATEMNRFQQKVITTSKMTQAATAQAANIADSRLKGAWANEEKYYVQKDRASKKYLNDQVRYYNTQYQARQKLEADYDQVWQKGLAKKERVEAAAARAQQVAANKMIANNGAVGISLNSLSNNLYRFGTFATMAFTLPLVALATLGVKSAVELEQIKAKTIALANVSKEQMDAWSGAITRIGIATNATSKSIAQSLYFVSSAGVDNANAMKMVEFAAKGSAAGLGETDVIAKLLTYTYNAYGKEAFDVVKIMDSLTVAVREGAAEAGDIVAVMGDLIPIGAQLGVSFAQMAGSLAAMTQVGMNAHKSATALRQIMVQLIKPHHDAAAALDQASIKMGNAAIASRNLTATIRDKGLLETLVMIKEAGEKMGPMFLPTVFSNVRAFNGFMAEVGPNLEKVRAIMKKTTEEVGAFDTALGIMTQTSEFKLGQFKKAWELAMLGLGEGFLPRLLPMLNSLVQTINDLTTWFKSLSSTTQGLILDFGVFLALLGPLTIALSGLVRLWAIIGMAWTGMIIPAIHAVGSTLVWLSGIMLANPYVAVAAGIVLLVYGLNQLNKVTKELTEGQKILQGVETQSAQSVIAEKVAIEQLLLIATNVNASLDQKQKAIKTINAISPEYLEGINQETISTGEATRAIDRYLKSLQLKAEKEAVYAALVELNKKRAMELGTGSDKELNKTQKVQTFLFGLEPTSKAYKQMQIENATIATEKFNEASKRLWDRWNMIPIEIQRVEQASVRVAKVLSIFPVKDSLADPITYYTSAKYIDDMVNGFTKYSFLVNNSKPEKKKDSLYPEDDVAREKAIAKILKDYEEGVNRITAKDKALKGVISTTGEYFDAYAEKVKLVTTTLDGLTEQNASEVPKFMKMWISLNGVTGYTLTTFKEMDKSLNNIDAKIKQSGGSFIGTSEKIDTYKSALDKLAAGNISSGSTVDGLKQKIKDLSLVLIDQTLQKGLADSAISYSLLGNSYDLISVKTEVYKQQLQSLIQQYILASGQGDLWRVINLQASINLTSTTLATLSLESATKKYTDSLRKLGLVQSQLNAKTPQTNIDSLNAQLQANQTYIDALNDQLLLYQGTAVDTTEVQKQLNAALAAQGAMKYTEQVASIEKTYNETIDKNDTKQVSKTTGRGGSSPWKTDTKNFEAYITKLKSYRDLAISIGDSLGIAEYNKRLSDALAPTKFFASFQKFNAYFQEIGNGVNKMLASYVDMINQKQQKAYDFIDNVAKREGKSAEWVAKQKGLIDDQYNKKKRQAAIAEAIINGALAITNIWAYTKDPTGVGLRLVASALSVANTAAQIAVISGQKMAMGGIVPSGYNNDTYPALLSSGETVIPARPNALPNFMGGRQTEFRQIRLNVKGRDLEYIFQEQEKLQNAY